jgi:hypothetical protein
MNIKLNKTDLFLGKNYTTHIPMLLKAVQMTDGAVLELGGGLFSTPLLHWLCSESRRKLITYESNRDFEKFLRTFFSRTHRIIFIDDWYKIDLRGHWSVAFIDHSRGNEGVEGRKKDALRLKDIADFIVLHDTNEKEYVRDKKFWSNFKYIYHWTWCTPNTSIVSNFYEIK